MQTIKEKYTSDITHNLQLIGYGLSYKVQQAWTFTSSYIANFLIEHPSEILKADDKGQLDGSIKLSDEQSVAATALLAAGRLGWLLQSTRSSLSGLFSEQDIATLLDCYQGDIFIPDQFNSIASGLCDHLDIELDEYETSFIAPLVHKLQNLEAVQRLTLADALEQAWYRGMERQGMSPKEFFATLGIELV